MIPVVWAEKSLDGDGRSHYGCMGLLNDTFDRLSDLTHYSTFQELPANADGAVVVIHGGNQLAQVDAIQYQIDRLRWSVAIVMCDEESSFRSERLVKAGHKIWIQMPVPNRHSRFADRLLTCGYPGDTLRELSVFDVNTPHRKYNWFFAGQINHQRRKDCVQYAQKIGNGFLTTTPGFAQGLTRADYFYNMTKSKFVLCPGGPATPDTMRVAEALEAGCLPIVDDRPGRRSNYPAGYWYSVFKETPPFPIITEWYSLQQVLANELSQWPRNRDRAQAWWRQYKDKMVDWMMQDITSVRGI